jgi:hypothetical protein
MLTFFFRFKILNHKSRFVCCCCCIHLLKIDHVTAIINFGHFFVSSKKEGIQRGTLVIHVMKCFGFFFLHFSGPLIYMKSIYMEESFLMISFLSSCNFSSYKLLQIQTMIWVSCQMGEEGGIIG